MKIILSNTSRGAYQGVINQLQNNMQFSQHNVVIAPDRFTAYVERGLLEDLKQDGSFNVDVMSFTRLANKIIGSQIKKCLTPEGSVMLIGKVILDVQKDLKYYGKASLVDGFASELYAALTAIRNSGISSEQLLANEDKMQPLMRAKARDIALIYKEYLSALEGKHSDSSTRLYALASYIQENPSCVATTNFYVMDIFEFSHPQLEILKGLAKNALSLTIGLPSGFDNANKRIYPDRVLSKLKMLTGDKIEIDTVFEDVDDQTKAILQNLFAYVNIKDDDKIVNDGKVVLREAKDRRDEVLRLALDVCKHVRKGGRYKDYEVYVSDLDGYEDDIKSVFSRYNIPYYIDKKGLLSDQVKTKYVLSAIACVRSNFALKEVLDFVKNPLFAGKVKGGKDSVYLFENYCLKYNINHTRFLNEFVLSGGGKFGNRPKQYFSYSIDEDKVSFVKDELENCIPEQVRKTLVETLGALLKLKSANIKKFVAETRKLLDDVNDEWDEFVKHISGANISSSKYAEQVDGKLAPVLDEIDEVLDYNTDLVGFESVFKAMIKTLKIALVPTALDCVFVGDKSSRFVGTDTIYVLGANNGKLPDISSGGIVISPKDEAVLASCGVEITPNETQKARATMFAVCDLLSKAKRKLYISYAQNGDGNALREATLIFELQNMFVEKSNDGALKRLQIERINFDELSNLDIEDKAMLFATQESCYHEYLRAELSGRAVDKDKPAYMSAFEFVPTDKKLKMLKSTDTPTYINLPSGATFGETTSVSRLETFFACPYKHYLRYILSLSRRKDGEFEGTENGTIIHAMLEQFFGELKDGLVNLDNLEERANRYFSVAIKENDFGRFLDKADTGRLLDRVRKEGIKLCFDLYRESKHTSFVPTMLEAQIGQGSIKPMSLQVGDTTIKLKGVIDRVDMLDDKFMVIDYKTYKSAHLDLEQIYYGEKIQLLIYMKAIEQSLNATPCGVYYFPIFFNFTDDKDDNPGRYKYKGLSLNDETVLQKIDDRVGSKDAFVDISRNRKGEMAISHMPSQTMSKIGDYAVEIATKGAEEILKGYISPSHLKESCKMCDFDEICPFKNKLERKKLKVTSLDAFDLKKEDADNE